MEVLLYNLFSGEMESHKTIFVNQRINLLNLIIGMSPLDRLYYFIYYLHLENERIKSIQNYIEYLDTNPNEVESPKYNKDFWLIALKNNANFIHFLKQQIEIITLINKDESQTIINKFNNSKEFINKQVDSVVKKTTLGYESDEIFYLAHSIKIVDLVNLIVDQNEKGNLNKIYIKKDLLKIIIDHFFHKDEKLNYETIKKYYNNNYSKTYKINLGEFENQYFREEIIKFLNKVLNN